jgi:hypothetical protein
MPLDRKLVSTTALHREGCESEPTQPFPRFECARSCTSFDKGALFRANSRIACERVRVHRKCRVHSCNLTSHGHTMHSLHQDHGSPAEWLSWRTHARTHTRTHARTHAHRPDRPRVTRCHDASHPDSCIHGACCGRRRASTPMHWALCATRHTAPSANKCLAHTR